MTKRRLLKSLAFAVLLPMTTWAALDTNGIEQITGLKGAWNIKQQP